MEPEKQQWSDQLLKAAKELSTLHRTDKELYACYKLAIQARAYFATHPRGHWADLFKEEKRKRVEVIQEVKALKGTIAGKETRIRNLEAKPAALTGVAV